MPLRDRITWGPRNPFSDPRLANLAILVHEIRRHFRLPPSVHGGRTFENRDNDLPSKPAGYYREYDLLPPPSGQDRGTLRLVLGQAGEVYITGNHYRDFRQVINLPELPCVYFANAGGEVPEQADGQYYHEYAWHSPFRLVIGRHCHASVVSHYQGQYGPLARVVWPWPVIPTR